MQAALLSGTTAENRKINLWICRSWEGGELFITGARFSESTFVAGLLQS
jgi:hypothetical protein